MKLHLLSDLHLEFAEFDVPKTDAEVVIIAGDLHVGERGLSWALENFNNQEVIYVIGNHEYYRGTIPKLTDKLRRDAKGTNIHILEDEEIILGDVVFLGCTLWSDFQLLNNLDIAVIAAQQMMNDFRLIRLSPKYGKIQPSDTAIWHRKSRKWLAEKIKKRKKDKKKIVVSTHHAPSILSVPARFKKDPLSAAFASEMSDFLTEMKVDLWVHGHIHDSSDYHIGTTRVICNPRGYPNEQDPNFLADMVVEI
jgi:predicted phosphohydrolase